MFHLNHGDDRHYVGKKQSRVPFLLLGVCFLLAASPFLIGNNNHAAYAADKPHTSSPDACVDNGYLTAQVDDSDGIYTFDVGTCSTDTNSSNYILYPLGTSFLTVTDFTTGVNYTEGGNGHSDPNVADLGTPTSSVATGSGNAGAKIVTTFPATPEGLVVTQTITVRGSTAATSVIAMSVQVENTGSTSQKVGIRYLWDTQVGGYDGTWLQQYSGSSPTCITGGNKCVDGITGYETDFFPPPDAFTSYAMSGCTTDGNPSPPPYTCDPSTFGPGSGTFEVYGSIASGFGATTPARFIYGYWSDMYGSAYAYAPNANNEIGSYVPNNDDTQDSAMLYYFANQTLSASSGSETVEADISNAPSAIVQTTTTAHTTTTVTVPTTTTQTASTTTSAETTVAGSTSTQTATTTLTSASTVTNTVETTLSSATCFDPTVTTTETSTVSVPTTITATITQVFTSYSTVGGGTSTLTTTYTDTVPVTTTQTVLSSTTECETTITTTTTPPTGVPQFPLGTLALVALVAMLAPALALIRRKSFSSLGGRANLQRIFRGRTSR